MDLPGNNTEWIERAFLQVEAVLTSEIGTYSGEYMSEEYIRSAMLRGLILTNPREARRVEAEMPAGGWSNNPRWDGQAAANQGSPCRHDVGVNPKAHDPGLICEVKWFKQAQTHLALQDIWKLAFSRGTAAAEQNNVRTFILLGGDHEAFSSVLGSLQENHFNFRWSAAGRGRYEKPTPKILDLERGLFNSQSVRRAAAKVLKRGQSGLRTPPECVLKLRLSVRKVWHNALAGRSWTAVLWELDHRGVLHGNITWNVHRDDVIAASTSRKKTEDEA
jgi:hypothetical protein